MSNYLPCLYCGADDASPCEPGCGCLSCQIKAVPLPDSVEGCLREANKATHEGREHEAQIHLIRMRHIAAGLG